MNNIKTRLTSIKYRSIIGPNFYYFLLIVLVVALPLSPYVTSMAQIWLGINWFLEGDFKRKLSVFKESKILYTFLIIPLVHLLWLINTHDFIYALNDLKIKVPLLILPVIIGTSQQLSSERFNRVLWFFTFALLASSIISLGVYLGIGNIQVPDIRNISIFVSHIRFSLMIVFAMCFLIWNMNKKSSKLTIKWKIISILIFLWFIIFLGILRTMTSWVILIILFYTMLFFNWKKLKSKTLRFIGLASLIIFTSSLFAFINYVYKDYHSVRPINFSELPTHTPRGNKYYTDTTKTRTERGYYYNILISWKELEEGWSKVSDVPFKSKDKNGYKTKYKIARYLTSLGLPKDLDGINQLDKEDIKLIEQGYASSIYRISFSPYIKVYEAIYELDNYLRTGNANNKSISMRIEFFKTGTSIIRNNFWTGVGTGDVYSNFQEAYSKTNSNLLPLNRLRTHNQYLTYFIAFGIFGFALCTIGLLGPFILTKEKSTLLLCFMIICLVSMLGEDLHETQAGVTFYILFYSFLVFNNKIPKQ